MDKVYVALVAAAKAPKIVEKDLLKLCYDVVAADLQVIMKGKANVSRTK